MVWATLVAAVITFQMASHVLSMPLPKNVNRFIEQIMGSRHPDPGKWTLVHVIYDHCSCTGSLLKHWVDRGPSKNAREVIMVVGDHIPYEKELEKAGFIIDKMERDPFVERFGIEAAPLLTVLDSHGNLKYMGGYFRSSATKIPLDEEIIRRTYLGETIEPLPLYGCALSRRLRKYIDPFGLSQI